MPSKLAWMVAGLTSANLGENTDVFVGDSSLAARAMFEAGIHMIN
jgi:hypothetical protein